MDELTIMFYFASDNPLAPLVVSEIKAIKDAGYQEDTNVLVYFDPMEKQAPTQLCDVNRARKKKENEPKTLIGDGANPFIRNMVEDLITKPELPDNMAESNLNAFQSLERFITFGITQRPAKNYMLFLVGHGMLIGNDAFLPDDDTQSAIALGQLKDLCKKFTSEGGETQLRLLALHSCSMSSIELAYQLRGTADYLMATQATVFVNGWPYRQLLKKTLHYVKEFKEKGENGVRANDSATVVLSYDKLITKLHRLCMHNFTDFLTAGYSCELAVCRLDNNSLEKLKESLKNLVIALITELKSPQSLIKDLVLLAHWDAQSFFSESYTDLWDFCDCLMKRCKNRKGDLEAILKDFLKDTAVSAAMIDERSNISRLSKISDLCEEVKKVLAPENRQEQSENRKDQFKGIVIHEDNAGSEFQFARGLSVYFPWCEPLDDQRPKSKSGKKEFERGQTKPEDGKTPVRQSVMTIYKGYDFNDDKDTSWAAFLDTYFRETRRAAPDKQQRDPQRGDQFTKAQKAFFEGVLKRSPELKRTPEEGPSDCTCPTIKNYPTTKDDKSLEEELSGRNFVQFEITPEALKAFDPRD